MSEGEIEEIKKDIIKINENVKEIKDLLELLNSRMDKEVIKECQKMGNHIDFIENVYENVKAPLGYINNRVKYIIGGNNKNYHLDSSNVLYIE
jgi:t-SNARE complex subunit (syntaxin)